MLEFNQSYQSYLASLIGLFHHKVKTYAGFVLSNQAWLGDFFQLFFPGAAIYEATTAALVLRKEQLVYETQNCLILFANSLLADYRPYPSLCILKQI